jgi:hypothetical protein
MATIQSEYHLVDVGKKRSGRTEHCGVCVGKIRKRIIEREDLGWADKCKVTTVEISEIPG